MSHEVQITCRRLSKSFFDIHEGKPAAILAEISLVISHGEFVTVIGPSGCGKSTLLYVLAGFEQPTSGELLIESQPVSGPGADRGVVFQEYALFPWLTLRQNVEYGPRERGLAQTEVGSRVKRALQLVNLEGNDNLYPHELSGGMRQRAALARVIVNDPKILLMDEPFAAVDAQTRATLQSEVAKIWGVSGKTIVFVTHSVEEAVLLGTRVVILSSRPARIIADIALELERPRDPTSPAFNERRREIERLLSQASAHSL